MKVSVSLPDEDVEFLDRYAEEHGFRSRSAVVHTAVRALRATRLGDAYADGVDRMGGYRRGRSLGRGRW